MLREHRAAYRHPPGALDASRWVPVGMDAHYGAVKEAVRADAALPGAPRETLHRRHRNHLPAALWAFAAVP